MFEKPEEKSEEEQSTFASMVYYISIDSNLVLFPEHLV